MDIQVLHIKAGDKKSLILNMLFLLRVLVLNVANI